MSDHFDSTGKLLDVGDPVRWRGQQYTVKDFPAGDSPRGYPLIEFEEPLHTDEVPDEVAVDLINAR